MYGYIIMMCLLIETALNPDVITRNNIFETNCIHM